MARLLIVRHGQSESNATGYLAGHADVGLTDLGRQQAQALARRLADVPIDVAYSSDLSRASETAQIILQGRDISLITTQQIREKHSGVFEGLTMEERKSRYPELYAASLAKDLDFVPPGGESYRQVSARMAGFVADIRQRYQDETVLIVGHGGSLRSAIVTLLDLPPEANWRFLPDNCSLSIIDTYTHETFGADTLLRLYNDTSHLDRLGPVS